MPPGLAGLPTHDGSRAGTRAQKVQRQLGGI